MSDTPTRVRGVASRRGRPRLVALAAALAVAFAGLTGLAESPAGAAPQNVTGATFEWSVSEEANAFAFNGQCNFMSAGQSDGSEATYTATNGNATVLKLNASDQYVPISSYASRCLDKDGNPVNMFNPTRRLGQKVRFTGGTGTVDPATGAATIQWTGSFSVNFYGTLVPFWITNPKLVVSPGGGGQVTATMGGFASDQADPDVRVPLPTTPNVVVATLAGVASANPTGFTTTPVFGGVTYDVDPESGQGAQNRTTPGWGSWPTSFVDFQMATGLGSYWYTSGGAVDPRKPPAPLTVEYGIPAGPDPTQAKVGTAYETFIPSAGVAPYTWSLKSGTLPPGLSLTSSTGRLAGTPTTEGRFKAVLAVTDSAPKPKQSTTKLTINVAPQNLRITTTTLPGIDLRVPYLQQLQADGGVGPYKFKVTDGTKPQGISVNGQGVVKGKSKTPGGSTFTVTVTDAFKFTATRTYTVQAAAANVTIVVAPASLPGASVGQPYSRTLTASGGTIAEYKFKRVDGKLPPKVKLDPKTGVISGTPTKAGSYPFQVVATDKYGYSSAPKAFTIVVS